MNFQHNLGYRASIVKYSRPAHSLRLYLNLFIVVDKLVEIHFQLVRDLVTVISHAACTSLWEYIEKLYIIKKVFTLLYIQLVWHLYNSLFTSE